MPRINPADFKLQTLLHTMNGVCKLAVIDLLLSLLTANQLMIM